MELCYPRWIHAEFLTHRVFSRNASSSRAIPTAKMIKQVRENPAMPIHWGKNQPGMQANEELSAADIEHAKDQWFYAAADASYRAEFMANIGAHKQIVNRILEPFLHIKVIVTATEWENFFELRCHPDAQPEIRELADQMRKAMGASVPVELEIGEWHLPYITKQDREEIKHEMDLIRVSVARCARVSYLTHDGIRAPIEKEIDLHDRLVASNPIHASPTEHQACAAFNPDGKHKNFVGWRQYRIQVEAEAERRKMLANAA